MPEERRVHLLEVAKDDGGEGPGVEVLGGRMGGRQGLHPYKAVTDSYPYECRGEDGKAVKFWRAEKWIAMFSLSLRKKQCIEIARPSGLREHGGCDTGPFPDLLHGGPAGMPVGEEGLPRQVHGGGDPGLLA